MSIIDYSLLAPLIRGLCVGVSQQPRVVISGSMSKKSSPQILTVELGLAIKEDQLDEEEAALILQEAYAAWEFEMAPSGVEAITKKSMVKKYPACIVILINNDPGVVFWIDRDLDTVRKRAKQEDISVLEERIPRQDGPDASGSSAQNRGEVVKKKIALVTGGAQGFGEEIVRGLVLSGALVFIADLNLEGAEKLAAKINAAEKRTAALAVAVNVADEASVEEMFRYVVNMVGGLDLCISNAGVLKAASLLEQDLESFSLVTDVNYIGFFLISKHASRLLRLQHRTAHHWKTDIIQINSKSGLEGSNKNGAYAGGKFGGLGLTESFALELVEYNIKVNAICPGNFFDGPLWSDREKGLFVQYLRAGKVPGARTIEDVKVFYESKVPMRRGCTGPDVMRAIYYIVEQEYETGQAVPVTGGQVMLH
ncbi:MAG: SDR family NAD(P)-dependent oxidoreductase [Spirochaetaceae bacterium]|jgi:sorbitol-6-phosphate 2-dehydrogenase|nr:SDR family NAD(P)-dependent oxidoreductase [Spirochaetaceae bacterium]